MHSTTGYLREGLGLRLDEAACLPLRSRHGQCRACAQACPKGVLSVSIDAVAVDAGCIECGRCAAACPNDALALDGLECSEVPAVGAQALEIECSRVPQHLLGERVLRVPCLGGLSVGRILELGERAAPAGLVLVDRGACARCEAGCPDRHPALEAVDRARVWLDAVGAGGDALPRIERRALHASAMLPSIPAREQPAETLSRREFFRAAIDKPAGRDRLGPVPMGSSGRAAFPPGARRESRERRRQIDALDAVARRHGTTIPAEFYPRVLATGACVDHRICTANCPTGALKVLDGEGFVSLQFSGEACIGCGSCARACPEGALEVDVHGGDRARVELARHRPAQCRECGDTFTPREADDALCMPCSKSYRFMRDAMARLHAAGR